MKSRLLALLPAALLLGGCQTMVTQERHETVVHETQTQVVTLNSEVESLRAERDALRTERDALLAERDGLRADLERVSREAAERIQALEREAERAGRLELERNAVRRDLERFVQAGAVSVERRPEGLALTIVDRILFDSGKADLKPGASPVLTRIAQILSSYPDRAVRVEGHTDNVPIRRSPSFASNWELSTARAHSVRRFLIGKNLEAKRFAVVGFAEHRPVIANSSRENRAKNRRVEVILLDPTL